MGVNYFRIEGVSEQSVGKYLLRIDDTLNECVSEVQVGLDYKQEYDFVLHISPKEVSDDLQFACDISSKTKPQVRWFYNDHELEGFGNYVFFKVVAQNHSVEQPTTRHWHFGQTVGPSN
ncbi:uncharacterized protein LOC115227870 [Octopus sinensis]|uniref:Uncharacterized protein LOC115227870 n=1 Tax=Octopus sinensis TaxID=2607531 RepID=A0A6P7TRN6_9MOLL|nr:uncharacterized protein LOC115227870 [Octopus sinensis]